MCMWKDTLQETGVGWGGHLSERGRLFHNFTVLFLIYNFFHFLTYFYQSYVPVPQNVSKCISVSRDKMSFGLISVKNCQSPRGSHL